MDIPTVNTTPAQPIVRLADVIGMKVECTSGYLKRWCERLSFTIDKKVILPKDFSYLKWVSPTSNVVDTSVISEGLLVNSQEPSVIYCLKGKGISRLTVNKDSVTEEELSAHPSILLSEGTWFFFKQQYIEPKDLLEDYLSQVQKA